MSNEPPSKLWLQWYGDPGDGTGIGHDQPEGATFNVVKVYPNDVCYIRAGKRVPGRYELELWQTRAKHARMVAETLLRINAMPDNVAIMRDAEGWPHGVLEIITEG